MQGVGEGMHRHPHIIRQGDEHDREHTPIMCTFASVGSGGCGDGELLSPNGHMVPAQVVSPRCAQEHTLMDLVCL